VRREIKIERARKLREEDPKRWTYEALGRRFGVSTPTAYRWLNPEYERRQQAASLAYKNRNREEVRAKNREYKRATRPDCPQCGSPMSHKSTLCEECRADEIDRRARQIEGLWAEGLPLKEIADRLGWTLDRLAYEMHRLREKGYELPYRYDLNGNAKFPEQVAA